MKSFLSEDDANLYKRLFPVFGRSYGNYTRIAYVVGMSSSHIGQILQRKRNTSIDTMRRIASRVRSDLEFEVSYLDLMRFIEIESQRLNNPDFARSLEAYSVDDPLTGAPLQHTKHTKHTKHTGP